MKMFRYSVFIVSLALFFVSVSLSQTSTARTYDYVEIEKFTIRDGVEFPLDKIDGLAKSMISNFNQSRRFKGIFQSMDTVEASIPTPRIRISGEVIKYQKGSRTTHYLIGMGTGKTKIIADVKFTDVESGEVLLRQTVDGIVSVGIFGGSSNDAENGMASEIIKLMRAKGYAGERRKN